MDTLQLLRQGDAITQGVALLMLAMSVASWVVILWKTWFLRRVSADTDRAIAAFWQAPHLSAAREQMPAFDRDGSLLPLIEEHCQLVLESLQVLVAHGYLGYKRVALQCAEHVALDKVTLGVGSQNATVYRGHLAVH